MRLNHLITNASQWAGECADNSGEPNEPMRDESVKRFLKQMRERLDYIEEEHFGKPEPPIPTAPET
jgi:hypothetical protein